MRAHAAGTKQHGPVEHAQPGLGACRGGAPGFEARLGEGVRVVGRVRKRGRVGQGAAGWGQRWLQLGVEIARGRRLQKEDAGEGRETCDHP